MKLIPPDKRRCQAEITEGSFMTFGPRVAMRCKRAPTWIARERRKPNGSMSLCDSCKRICEEQLGSGVVTFGKLPITRAARKLEKEREG